MPEECLSYLAVSIERQLTDSLSLDEVINKFAATDLNRKNYLIFTNQVAMVIHIIYT